MIAMLPLFGFTSSVLADSAELDDSVEPFSVAGGPGAGIWETAVDSPDGPYAMERLAAPVVADEISLGMMQAPTGGCRALISARSWCGADRQFSWVGELTRVITIVTLPRTVRHVPCRNHGLGSRSV